MATTLDNVTAFARGHPLVNRIPLPRPSIRRI
jgi:hypothetical protein